MVIETAVRTLSVVEYLGTQSLYPAVDFDGRYKYCCPLHEEDTPSFIVYPATEGDGQNFFCYGCRVGGDIITLKSELEHITVGEAIRALVKGFNFDDHSIRGYAVERLKKLKVIRCRFGPNELALTVGKMVRTYLTDVQYSEPYFSQIQRMLAYFDLCLYRLDIEQANYIYENLHPFLIQQRALYFQQLEKAITAPQS